MRAPLDPMLAAALGERPLRFMAFATVLFVIAAALAAVGNDDGRSSVLPLATLVFSVAMTRGFVGADRDHGRWFILFQNPVDPVRHYARVFAASFLIVLVLLASIVAAAAIAAPHGVTLRSPLASFTASALLALQIHAAAAGISACARRHDVELLVLLIAASLGFQVYLTIHAVPDYLASSLSLLLFPVKPLWAIADAVAGTGPTPDLPALAHVILYPVAWLLLASWQIRRLARGVIPIQ
jgi:hypothetical protein